MNNLQQAFITSIPYRYDLRGEEIHIRHVGFDVRLFHAPQEPPGINRLILSDSDFTVEVLPSKGLTMREAHYRGRPLFWDSPAPLFDPDTLALESDEIRINGIPAPGFVYLKTFTGGVELLGLRNWGMPYTDSATGEFHVLHGDVGNIPVEELNVTISASGLQLSGSFIVRTGRGDSDRPWYQRGEKLYAVTRHILLTHNQPIIRLRDEFKNISQTILTPDWGYHVTLRPENGAEFLIPSRHLAMRGGGNIPADHAQWRPAAQARKRVECGVIHQQLQVTPGILAGHDGVRTLLRYPDGTGIAVTIPPAPYFQTWFCAGGAYSNEFTYANGTPVLTKNWDGQGIEFGSSALDHDGHVDLSVPDEPTLPPGASRIIQISIAVLSPEETALLAADIDAYNRDRIIPQET